MKRNTCQLNQRMPTVPFQRSLHRNLKIFQFLKNAIAPLARFFDFTRFQRKPQALGRCICLMDREMTPPDAAIVPQVMVLVGFIHAKRQLGKLGCCDSVHTN